MFCSGPCLQQAGLAGSTHGLCRQPAGSRPPQTSSQACLTRVRAQLAADPTAHRFNLPLQGWKE